MKRNHKINRDYLVKLFVETFRGRKTRRIGNITLQLSVLPDDIPDIELSEVGDKDGALIITFKPKYGEYSEELAELKSEPMWKDEEGLVEIYEDPIRRYIRKIIIRGSPDKAIVILERKRQELEEELMNMGSIDEEKVNSIDTKERQVEGVEKILEEI